MKSARSQKGMSLLGWLVTLCVVGFLASTAFKVLPHYFDYMSLNKVINSVETDKTSDVRTVGDFYAHVSRGLEVNGIRDFDLQNALKVNVENNQFHALLKYEKREVLLKNIDLVVRFDKEFRVQMP